MENPVSVSCGHIFCEKCIIGQFKDNRKKCIICNQILNGIFNNANKIIEHIKNLKNKKENNENKNKNKYTLIGKEKIILMKYKINLMILILVKLVII